MRAYLSIGLAVCVSFSSIHAQDSRQVSAGVDAKGVRHTWRGSLGNPPPYVSDSTKRVTIVYPYDARKARREGAGFFRLQIDLATGNVIKVTILKSTGAAILDKAALSAFRGWKFKPRTWKEIDVPVKFSLMPGSFGSR
jgi:TonB family protein